jgi:tetratricopeptide (TPR) repeat protein
MIPEWLASRLPHLIVIIGILFSLSPTPVAVPWTEALNQAMIALDEGRPEIALGKINQALAFEPDAASLHVTAAQAALAAGQPAAGLAHLDQAHAMLDVSGEESCLRAELLLEAGQPAAALQLWEQSALACRQPLRQLRGMLTAEMATDNPAGGEAVLTRLVAADPADLASSRQLALIVAARDPQAALGRLRLLGQSSRTADPLAVALIAAIEQAQLAQDPAFVLARVGQTLAKFGEWQLAKWAFRRALQLDPNYVEARASLGQAIDQRGGDGLGELQAALDAAPQAIVPQLYMAMHWLSHGQPERALALLSQAQASDPTNAAILLQIGRARAALGDINAALLAYRQAAELAPDQAGFWLVLARYSLSNEVFLVSVGLPAARNAAALDPHDPAALTALAYATFLNGEADLAQRLIYRALAAGPANPETLYRWGMVEDALGNSEQAERAWRAVIALDSSGPIADLARRALGLPLPAP